MSEPVSASNNRTRPSFEAVPTHPAAEQQPRMGAPFASSEVHNVLGGGCKGSKHASVPSPIDTAHFAPPCRIQIPVMDWGKGPYLVPGASLVTFHLITVRSQLPVNTKSPSHATQDTFWAFVV